MTLSEAVGGFLPIHGGPFSLELEPDGQALRYRGVVQAGWSSPEEQPVDARVELEALPTGARLAPALQAWASVLRQAFDELGRREAPSLAPKDVLDQRLLRELVEDEKVPVADFERRWTWRLAAALPPLPELEAAAAAVRSFFEAHPRTLGEGLHPEGHRSTLEFVSAEVRDGHVSLVVRLMTWTDEEGKWQIESVKEQEVFFLEPGPGLEPERVTSFLTAFTELLSPHLAKVDPSTLMPHDLIISPQRYKSGASADDFRRLLRRKLA